MMMMMMTMMKKKKKKKKKKKNYQYQCMRLQRLRETTGTSDKLTSTPHQLLKDDPPQ